MVRVCAAWHASCVAASYTQPSCVVHAALLRGPYSSLKLEAPAPALQVVVFSTLLALRQLCDFDGGCSSFSTYGILSNANFGFGSSQAGGGCFGLYTKGACISGCVHV